MNQFIYIIIVTLFLGGCVNTTYESGDLKVRTFLTDHDRSYYVFLSEKYSFVFSDKKSVDKITEMIKIYSILNQIEIDTGVTPMGNPSKSLFKNLTDRDKYLVTPHITFFADPSKNSIKKLEKYGFYKSTFKWKKGYYQRSFFLRGTFTNTDPNLATKYQKNFLKKPLKFRYYNRTNSTSTFDAERTSELMLALGGAPIVVPLVAAGWGTIGVLGITAPVIKSVTD